MPSSLPYSLFSVAAVTKSRTSPKAARARPGGIRDRHRRRCRPWRWRSRLPSPPAWERAAHCRFSRSEEGRVGKEGRIWWVPVYLKKKIKVMWVSGVFLGLGMFLVLVRLLKGCHLFGDGVMVICKNV